MQKLDAPPAPPNVELERLRNDDPGSDSEGEAVEDDDPATLASALATPPSSPRTPDAANGGHFLASDGGKIAKLSRPRTFSFTGSLPLRT